MPGPLRPKLTRSTCTASINLSLSSINNQFMTDEWVGKVLRRPAVAMLGIRRKYRMPVAVSPGTTRQSPMCCTNIVQMSEPARRGAKSGNCIASRVHIARSSELTRKENPCGRFQRKKSITATPFRASRCGSRWRVTAPHRKDATTLPSIASGQLMLSIRPRA